MLKAAKYGWGWRREITLFSEGGEGDNVSKRWRSDIVGFRPEDGKMCVIDVNVITLAAASYRGARRTLRSRCLRTLDEAVKAKLKLPHAAARAKDLNAKHIIFAMSSNGAFSRQARKFFNDVKRHVQDQGRTHMGISFRDSYGSNGSNSFTTRILAAKTRCEYGWHERSSRTAYDCHRSDAGGKDCHRWERRACRAQGLREGWLRRAGGAIGDVQVETV